MERTMQKCVQVDGSWVTVDVYGPPDGAAIVVIPGAMADAAGWAEVAQRLEGWEAVAVVNRRGRHPSGPLTDGYGLSTEIADTAAVVREFSDVRTLFGWSYGGLIALSVANVIAVPHVIAYEPVMAPFGAGALPDLHRAHASGELDESVDVALRRVAGMEEQAVAALRSQEAIWAELRRLAAPIYAETHAINDAPEPGILAADSKRVDLIVGELNQGLSPYGTTFDDVARHVPHSTTHLLDGQAHLAHLDAPEHLAALVDRLGGEVL